jgi:hypothetical protein
MLLVRELAAGSTADADPAIGVGARAPSLLGARRRRRIRDEQQQQQQQQAAGVVKYYWPVLTCSLTAHVTAKPPELLVV